MICSAVAAASMYACSSVGRVSLTLLEGMPCMHTLELIGYVGRVWVGLGVLAKKQVDDGACLVWVFCQEEDSVRQNVELKQLGSELCNLLLWNAAGQDRRPADIQCSLTLANWMMPSGFQIAQS